MAATFILWSHALAAMLFGALALWAWRRREGGVPRRALAFALAMTAVWGAVGRGQRRRRDRGPMRRRRCAISAGSAS